MELPDPEATKALAAELGKASPDKQILLTLALGNRRDAAALPALLSLAKAGEKRARIAAVRAAVEIGGAATVPVFVALMADPEPEIAAIAQSSLAALSGPEVDAAIAAMLGEQDPKARIAAIELLERRRATGSVPALMKATADPDESVRIASIKVLGGMAGLEEYPALVNLLVKAKSTSESRAAERALGATAVRLSKPIPGNVVIHKALYGDLPNGKKADVTRKVKALVKRGATAIEASNSNFGDPVQGTAKKMTIDYTANGVRSVKTVRESESIALQGSVTPPACVDALCAALPKAPSDAKLALLRLLRSAGGPKALSAVLAATKDNNAEVAGAATSLLCQWPTADALPHVIQLAKTSKDPKNRILGLRGYIRLIPQQEGTVQAQVASMKEAMGLATRNEEKKLALSVLGTLPTAEALALVSPCLGDKALKEEASIAAVAIAEKIIARHPAEVAKAMETVTQETTNRTLAREARKLLNEARKAAPRK
jgi:HEAT repeat protein